LTQLSRVSEEGRLLDTQTMRDLVKFQDRPDVQAALGTFLETETRRVVSGLATFLQHATVTSVGTAQAVEGSILAAFGGLTSQGVSPLAAIEQLLPVIDQFGAKTKDLVGFQASEAFGALLAVVGLVKDEVSGPVIQAVSGLGQVLVGLQNTGLLTQEVFGGLSRSIYDSFKALEAQGKGGETAIRAIQQPLQRTWELVKDFGYTVDEDTAKLLEFAESSGLIGDKFRPAADRMAAGIERLVDLFERLITTIDTDLVRAADRAASDVVTSFDRMRPTIRVGVDLDTKWQPYGEVLSFAQGSRGVMDFGPGTLAVLHGREAVLTEAQLAALAAEATDTHVQVFLGEDVLVDKVLRGAHRTIRLYGT
jgi:hypothetical protein